MDVRSTAGKCYEAFASFYSMLKGIRATLRIFKCSHKSELQLQIFQHTINFNKNYITNYGEIIVWNVNFVEISAKLVECLIALSESSNFHVNETGKLLKHGRIKEDSKTAIKWFISFSIFYLKMKFKLNSRHWQIIYVRIPSMKKFEEVWKDQRSPWTVFLCLFMCIPSNVYSARIIMNIYNYSNYIKIKNI